MRPDLWEALTVALLTAAGVGLTVILARRTGLIDVPNHRSSHHRPTPRGGGVALVASILMVAAYELTLRPERHPPFEALLAIAVITLTFVGWLDDKHSLPVSIRLAVHLACGIVVSLVIMNVAPVQMPLQVAWIVWWVFWTAASINIVNFMDGIDGMIASQGIVYGVFLYLLLPPDNFGSRLGLILAAGCSGFLLWNWAPAKIFLGDVGSGPLGLLFVLGGAFAIGGAPVSLVFLPLFPLFLDALLTLVARIRAGESVTESHRGHLYQRIANAGLGHAIVTSAYAVVAAAGALIAISVRDAAPMRRAVSISVYLVAVGLAWMLFDKTYPRVRDSDRGSQPSAAQ